MKYLKFFIIFLIMAFLAFGGLLLYVNRKPVLRMAGKISPVLQREYNRMVADEINKKGITLLVNGVKSELSGTDKLFMTDELQLVISALDINDCFSCDMLWRDEESVILGESILPIVDGKYIPLEEFAFSMGEDFEWNEDEATARMRINEVEDEELPSFFDLRQEGRISPVRDQGNEGNCWAFASISALESFLLPEEEWDFSEDNMVNKNPFSTGGEGGDFNMALAYTMGWVGPVTEDEDPYGDEYSPDDLKPSVHVQSAVILNEKDREQIKRLVYNYGAVQSAIYSPTDNDELEQYFSDENASFYYPFSTECSHDIDIVGWDDDYSRDNFLKKPDDDGAFICKNSWGESFGESGFFYISYQDPNIGIFGAAYTRADSPDNYDNIYQSDLMGWTGSIGYEEDAAKMAAVYSAGSDETIRAAGFYTTDKNSYYDLYLVNEFSGIEDFENRQIMCSGFLPDKGYYTIDFEKEVKVKKGERFAVVVDIRTEGAKHPIAMEYTKNKVSSHADISDGETYMSSGWTDWVRLEETQECNACLKAYTSNAD